MTNKNKIIIHTAEDFGYMRKAGKLAAAVLDMITSEVKEGITTNYLNDLCHEMILDHGAIPAPLNYKGFPKSICTSLNNVICHGIPNSIPLSAKDVLNIDITVILDGWHGDTSRMYWIDQDKTPVLAKRLTQVTHDAMLLGIEQIKPGNSTLDIARAIQDYVEKFNYSVVRDYCGHGIGTVFHCDPSILHYYKAPAKQQNKREKFVTPASITLQEGMFFTVEPMINAGYHHTKLMPDGWTVKTKDRSLSCQFEHTIGVTKDGVEIFTKSAKGLDHPPYN